mgnify:CR=1 FL=1
MMCPNCILYMLLGAFIYWRINVESNDPKLNQSWEDMAKEIMKKKNKKNKK